MSTLVTCPVCEGIGLGVIDGEAAPCWLSGYKSYVELPATPEQADAIYATCLPDSAAGELVQQRWDAEGDETCPHCIGGEPCEDCWREQEEAAERNYRATGRIVSW